MNFLKALNKYNIIDFHVHDTYDERVFQVVFPPVIIPEITFENKIVRCSQTDGNVFCFTCGPCHNKVYLGVDPYKFYNETLLKNKTENQIVFPIVTISPYTEQNMKYYESKYKGQIIGFKLHPNFSEYKVENLEINDNKILLFHTGVDEMEDPKRVVEFAKNYCGTVIIAHMGRFDKTTFDLIKNMENVYLDCSSLELLWQTYKTRRHRLFDTSYLGEFTSPTDMIKKCVEYLGSNKIIFGSDTPYGDMYIGLKILSELHEQDYQNITYNNAKQLLKRYLELNNYYNLVDN